MKFGTFPDDWKKGNVLPVHKKGNKQIVNIYRPVSLLPICSKIFEKLVFDAIFKFMIENNLLSGTQSGFKPNDSCVNQLILITHNVFSVFDANPLLEVRGFLDLSKAFDRVWHRDLLHKLKNRGINGNLLDLIESFLYNRCQRLVLIGQPSN